MTDKKKLLMISPHFSTGGMPQVALKKIENLIGHYDVMVIEYADITAGLFTVQKNKIKQILPPDKFITLGNNKKELISIIENFKPNYIHLEEVPETFMDFEVAKRIYKKDREYFITETTHNVLFDVSSKKFFPDKFMHVSKYIADIFNQLKIPYEIIEYPIEMKERPDRTEKLKEFGLDPEYRHVLNVGLFTPGKNQKEIIDIARLLINEKIQFHFVGNQAGNFQSYWQPLMENKPENCIVWGERSDTESFYGCMDLFLFTSTYELNPIVIKEALSHEMKILMYNLEPYDGAYNNNANIQFLGNHIFDNIVMIKNMLYSTESLYPSRCYITHTTKNYSDTTFGLIYSLLEYSTYPIVVYTVNFNISEISNPFKNNANVYFIEYSDALSPNEAILLETNFGKYVDRKFNDTYKILTMKSKVLLKSFELGITEGVYLDSDSVVRYNVDDLMLEIKNVKNYPLLTRGVYDIMLEDGKGDIERPLMEHLGVKERSMMYVQSNIVVFTNKCKEFIEEWKTTCEDETILLNFEKWAPYQDETIANVLLWKHGYTEHLPMYHFNIRNPKFVEEFEKFDDTDKSKFSEHMLGFPFYIDGKQMDWSFIPYNKEDVKVFHGIKKLDEMIDIIEYQNRIKKDFCMIQMHDDTYSELASITSKINKEYCDKHGYDYICYNRRIVDDNKPIHWQRYPMIKRHLRNYKWMFFLDIDAMIMNYNIKLEDLIDNKFDIIMENMGDSTDILDETNKKYADSNYNILASAILLKNSKTSKDFLTDIYNDVLHCNNELQYDNSAVRCTIGHFDKYKKATKVFPCDSKKLNAFWYTNKPSYIFHDGPKWNDMGNMYEVGDFILHIVAYDTEERISLAKQFLPYVIKKIKNTTKINILQIGSHVGNTINDPIFSKVDNNSKMILVEPVPYLFNQLKDNYKNKMNDTSNIIFINKAVSNFIGEIELTVPSERNDFSIFPFWASQLASVDSNHALQHIPNIIVDKIKVETTTIDEIINQYNIEEIDLLHTDTEGHDYAILMSYSFRIKSKKILFEHKHMDGIFTTGNKYEELVNKLKSMGYKKMYQNDEDTMFELQ